jgi:hypothetical protein
MPLSQYEGGRIIVIMNSSHFLLHGNITLSLRYAVVHCMFVISPHQIGGEKIILNHPVVRKFSK